jgi:hypothetical protein
MEEEMSKIRFIIMLTLTIAFLSLLTAVPVWAAPPLHHASGGGFLVLPASGGSLNDVMFAFNARQLNEDGNAQGQFEQHNLSNGGIVHLKIFHMEFDGNEVYLFGEITKSINTNAKVGDERAVRLQDNGEGIDAELDMRSKLYKPAYPPSFDLLPLEGGNIKIR